MKILKSIALGLAVLGVALVGLYFVMVERGEVVVLHSHDADGDHETRLWVVDDGGAAWLRTGAKNASWLPRIHANSAVEVERTSEAKPYNAIVIFEPNTIARINQLTLAKYGWSEKLLRAAGTDPAGQVAIRLDPR
jgi:hypothetical protein